MRSEWKANALVLSACLVGHVIVFAWLHRYSPASVPDTRSPRVMQVTLIEPAPEPPPPPMPRRPLAKARARAVSAPILRERPWRAPSGDVATIEPESRVPQLRQRLSDPLQAVDLFPENATRYARPDPMNPLSARLPGSNRVIVEGFHVRRERSVADVVNLVGGMLFGGNYDPCPDIQGKLHDATVLRPEKYRDSERSALVERERRCRYR